MYSAVKYLRLDFGIKMVVKAKKFWFLHCDFWSICYCEVTIFGSGALTVFLSDRTASKNVIS